MAPPMFEDLDYYDSSKLQSIVLGVGKRYKSLMQVTTQLPCMLSPIKGLSWPLHNAH